MKKNLGPNTFQGESITSAQAHIWEELGIGGKS